MISSKASQFVVRHRVAASILGCTILGAVLVITSMAGAQQAPGYDPPLPPSMAEPPGKPQYPGGATPTPDPVRTRAINICTTVPDLCGLARGLRAAHSRGDLAAFTSLLSPVQVPCFNPERGARTPGELCAGQPDSALISGYTVASPFKQASVASEGQITSLLNSRLQVPTAAGRPPVLATPLSAGCAISPDEEIDCSVTAIALGLTDAKTKAIDSVVILVFRQDFGGRRFALVGAFTGLTDGSTLTGGPERRFVGGWTGNKTGGWYFELLDPAGR